MSAPYRRSLAAALASALAAAFVVGVVDAGVALHRGEEAVAGGVAARFVAGTVCYYVLVALGVAVIEGLIAGAVRRSFPVAERAVRAWRRLRADPDADADAAAGLLAAGLAALGCGAALTLFQLAVALGMARRMNTALATTLAVFGLLPLGVLLWFPLWRAARRLTRILPGHPRVPRLLTVAALGLLAAVAGALRVLGSIDWRVIDFGPYLAAAGVLAVQGLWLGLLYGSARGAALRRALPGRAVLGVALALGVAGGGWTLLRFEADPRLPDLALRQGSGVKSLLRLARAVRRGDLTLPTGGAGAEADDFAAAPGAAPAPPASVPARTARPATGGFGGNVLIVTIDAVRADRLGIAGYRRHITPNIDRLVARSTYFRRAYAQAPNTPRSFPSFVTSQPPSRVRWRKAFANFSPIRPDSDTWFLDTAAAGLRNIGIFSHFYFTRERGLARGFAEWDNAGAKSLHDSNTDIAAPRIVPRVVRRLEQAARTKERFLLWTYLFEPHSRYMAHPEFPIVERGLQGLEEKYDYEIAFADLWLGKILDALERTGLAKNTIVVLFADHGEGFGEHRHFFHGQSVYEEMIHVPLVFHVPGLAPRVVEQPVALTDVGPTLIDLLGMPPRATFAGRSLAPALRGEPLEPRPVVAELLPAPSWNHQARAVIDGQWKAIYKVSDGLWEMYDLAADPSERRNLFHTEPARAATLKRELLGLLQR